LIIPGVHFDILENLLSLYFAINREYPKIYGLFVESERKKKLKFSF
jgi:hypothetical protein